MPDRDATPAAAEGADRSICVIERRMWSAEQDVEELLYLVQVDMPYLVELAKAARPAPPAAATDGEAVALLKELEWKGTGTGLPATGRCMMCSWQERTGHAPGCRLGSFLATAAAPREAARGEGES